MDQTVQVVNILHSDVAQMKSMKRNPKPTLVVLILDSDVVLMVSNLLNSKVMIVTHVKTLPTDVAQMESLPEFLHLMIVVLNHVQSLP